VVHGERSRRSLAEVLIALLLVAVALAAVVLFWGAWLWMVVAAAVAIVQIFALRRSERFSARVWRSVPVGRRRQREQGVETAYVVSAVAGVVLFVIALVRLLAA
jgi:hypothetical protein